MNISELIDSFLLFECEKKMFEIEIHDVFIWNYIRSEVFYDLLDIINHTSLINRQTVQNDKVEERIEWKLWIERNILKSFFFSHKKDILIISNPRKMRDDNGYYKDIYSDLLDSHLQIPHYVFNNVSKNQRYILQKSKNNIYGDIDRFYRFINAREDNYLPKKSELNNKIFIPLESFFNIEIDNNLKSKWYNKIQYCIKMRERYISYYSCILKRIKPKVIIMTNAYSFCNQILCETAKMNKIPTIELEHGMAGNTTISYNFYNKMNLPSFPDYFFCFGNYEKESTRWPISTKNVITVGFPELERNVKKYKTNKMNENRKVILFISSFIPELAKCAKELNEIIDSEKYHIIYKLHPLECAKWQQSIAPMFMDTTIEVIHSFEQPIHYYLGKADWVVGVQSTAMYEASAFNIKIAVFNCELAEGAKALIDTQNAILVNNAKDLSKQIIEDTFIPNTKMNFFETNSLKKMERAIRHIISQNKG